MHTKSLVGMKFDRLQVDSFSHRTKHGMAHYYCTCTCGTVKTVAHGNLMTGHTKSCGCFRKEKAEEVSVHGFTRNGRKSQAYRAWCKLKERCLNPNSIDYVNYGAKGIAVSPLFVDNFMNFFIEVGEPPSNEISWSIDRINHKVGYEPGNLRWATDAQQARNKGKMKNNSSGVTGVLWENKVHPNKMSSTTYAVAIWKEDGLLKKKCFSILKYGLLPAFDLAVKHRKDQIKRLNLLGYGYTPLHGL